jgi:hypothetical protein
MKEKRLQSTRIKELRDEDGYILFFIIHGGAYHPVYHERRCAPSVYVSFVQRRPGAAECFILEPLRPPPLQS